MGFRPFICRLAIEHGLNGEVDNRTNGVLINVEGDEKKITDFCDDIIKNAPPASQIKSIEKRPRPVNGYRKFSITTSNNSDNQITEISPDIAVCPDCLNDLDHDKERINYPFVNCTNCGPRFTIIEDLPYDRDKTSMKDFKMCTDCSREYGDFLDRRFHAQPVACNKCGPVYTYKDAEVELTEIEAIISEISKRINEGKSVAVKGLGGYHLMCDALNNNAVLELREKKHRDAKPFGVMFRDIKAAGEYCCLNEREEREISSWRRPIVILNQKKELAQSVNSGLKTTGAMLPYMPLHYLLFRRLKTTAVVLTSGNISDEPVIIDDTSAMRSLMPIAGSILSNNREIINRTDDSVVKVIGDKINIIRRSRGYVPAPVDICLNADGILALGAEQKNSFCIGRDYQAIMSQFIGDLKNLPTYSFFTESIEKFSSLFRFRPKLIVCDLHPDYLSTGYAGLLEKRLHIPVFRVQHHHAHIASVMAENDLDEKVIGISMDGTGYGTDGHTWGGEFLIADLTGFTRYTHFDYVPMPGGDKVIEEPWRMAFSYLYKYYGDRVNYSEMRGFSSIDMQHSTLVKEMVDKEINAPMTSGAGRLFDSVSAILGICLKSDFDSEAPMRLESAIHSPTDDYYPFEVGKTIVFAKTLMAVLKDLSKADVSVISARFHNTVAMAILDVSVKIRKEASLNKVVLSGGVFQNKYLLEKLTHLLTENRFEVFTNQLVPSNDGGVSLGQLIIASKMRELCV